MPWNLTTRGSIPHRDFDKHLINNWAVCSNHDRNKVTEGKGTNPFIWALLETALGPPVIAGNSPSLEGRFEMWGPTSGKDAITLHTAGRKLGREFKEFDMVIRIIRPDIRDSLHTAGKYDCGRSFLDYIQVRLESSDSPTVREWVKKSKTIVGSITISPKPARWLESYLHRMKEMLDSQLGAQRWNTGTGTFTHPIIIEGPMGMRYDFNFPLGYSPRLSQICDFLTMNISKFKKSNISNKVNRNKRPDPKMDPFLWSKYANQRTIYCYEIFHIVQCDQNDLLVVPCLYDMGVGDYDTLHGGVANGVWNRGPAKEPGGPFRYPKKIQSTPAFQKAYRWRHNLHRSIPGASGHTLLRLPRSIIQKQYTGRGVVDKNNEPKFGDYILMARTDAVEDASRAARSEVKTVPGIDGISDLIYESGQGSNSADATEFFHITMSQAAMGNKKRTNPDNPSPFDHYSPAKYDGANPGGGARPNPTRDRWVFNSGESMTPWDNSKAKKVVRPFEKMEPQEIMSFMVGMTTADAENHDISDGARVDESTGKKIIFVPTWKDRRERATLNLTDGKGDYYSDIIRCGECNGRTLVMLPSGNELEAAECPHCAATGGLNTSHLVEGNPMPQITPLRPNR